MKRPKLTLWIAALVLLVCAGVSYDIPISTSRYSLVAADNPYQARLLSFFERFGYPGSLVLVVSGGTPTARQAAVDSLSRGCEAMPELKGRVLGKLGAQELAEVLFLFQPDAPGQLTAAGAPDPETAFSKGLPGWINAIDGRLNAALENEGEGEDKGGQAKASADPAAAFDKLSMLFSAMNAALGGTSTTAALPQLAKSVELPPGATLDEQGYLTTSDGLNHVVALFPELKGGEGHQAQPLVDKVRQLSGPLMKDGVEIRLTGLPALVADELAIVKNGMVLSSAATGLGILLLLWLAFRSLRYTVLALIPLAVGIVLTLTVARTGYGGLNLVTSSFISVLLALGIDFGVYVLSRYAELLRQGHSTLDAIRGALNRVGPGMIIGAITTMMAFLMTTTIEFTAYAELGVITAVGLALMLLVTFLLLPTLLMLAGRGKALASPELPGMSKVVGIVRRAHWVILVVAIGAALASTQLWGKLAFNPRYFDFLPTSTESAAGLRRIENDQQFSPVHASIGTSDVESARQITDQLRQLESVAVVQSATDMLPPLDAQRLASLKRHFGKHQAQPDFSLLAKPHQRPPKELAGPLADLADTLDEVAFALRQTGRDAGSLTKSQEALATLRKRIDALPDGVALGELEMTVASVLSRAWATATVVASRGHYLPTDLPEVFRARFASKDGTGLAVFAGPSGDIWTPKSAQKFTEDVEGVAPDAAGLAMTIHEHMRMIREGFTKASGWSAALVLLVLLVGFRRLGHALLAMLPVALGGAWMMGLMGLIGLDFDVANVVVLPLLTGVGVDAGAHMVHRWRQSAAANGGVADLKDLVQGTGAAVVLASLTSATGFAALMLADYGAMQTLGLAMVIGIMGCLLASVLVLPALLVVLKRAA